MFEVEAYASRYRGHGRINRLIFIAETSPQLRLDAYRLAFSDVARGKNVALYKQVTTAAGVSGAGEIVGECCSFNQDWVHQVEKHAAQLQDKLESDLNQAKGALIKESIRMGHNDLGDFFMDRGDLNAALKSYVRTRDYCTTQKHQITMCLNVIRVSIELSNYAQVANYVTKAEQCVAAGGGDEITSAMLRCASGLAHLDGRRYKLAAKQFLEVPTDLQKHFNRVISCEDVATFGSLCALASFDRAELKAKVMENPSFKGMLELTPRVRELVRDFFGSKYSSCLTYLEELRPELTLCFFLHTHVENLYRQIRHRALIQYVSPYTSVDLCSMAQSFRVDDVSLLEKELAELIAANKIQARIDSHKKVLFARHADQRNLTFRRALGMGTSFARETRAMLLRMELVKNDFFHEGPQKNIGVPGSLLGTSRASGALPLLGQGCSDLPVSAGGYKQTQLVSERIPAEAAASMEVEDAEMAKSVDSDSAIAPEPPESLDAPAPQSARSCVASADGSSK